MIFFSLVECKQQIDQPCLAHPRRVHTGYRFEQVKASNRYTLEHFDQDLRTVMWRVGVQGEQVCFIFDESNVLSPAFLER